MTRFRQCFSQSPTARRLLEAIDAATQAATPQRLAAVHAATSALLAVHVTELVAARDEGFGDGWRRGYETGQREGLDTGHAAGLAQGWSEATAESAVATTSDVTTTNNRADDWALQLEEDLIDGRAAKN